MRSITSQCGVELLLIWSVVPMAIIETTKLTSSFYSILCYSLEEWGTQSSSDSQWFDQYWYRYTACAIISDKKCSAWLIAQLYLYAVRYESVTIGPEQPSSRRECVVMHAEMLESFSILSMIWSVFLQFTCYQWPLLRTCFNFNPSMDK